MLEMHREGSSSLGGIPEICGITECLRKRHCCSNHSAVSLCFHSGDTATFLVDAACDRTGEVLRTLREEGLELRRQGLTADVMVASTNAITLDGRLVNLDGMGNRVAAMAFGPKKVILVVGMNKVAPDLESAVARVKNYAAPINNIRYGLKNPCVETGLCSDCRSPQRICNMWSTIEGHMIEGRIHVKLVGESLGY